MEKQNIHSYVYVVMTLFLFPLYAKAQDKNNYILTETQISNSAKIQEYSFFDGLGREYLKASNGINTNGKFVYSYKDILGENLIENSWLPVVDNATISPLTHENIRSKAESQYDDKYAYNGFEYDVAGNIKKKTKAGLLWKRKPVSISYVTNAESDIKRYPIIHPAGNSELKYKYYEAGTLAGICETDEDGIKVTTYTDASGRKILERRGSNNDTYFVYDAFDRLTYVLTPEYQMDDDLDKYAYQYKYDLRGNLVSKKIPGCSPIEYNYDNCERCVSIQDGELKRRELYRFLLYDELGRLAVQGLSTTPSNNSKSGIVKLSIGSNGIGGSDYKLIDGSDYNLSIDDIEIVNYYDDYEFINGSYKELFQGIELPSTHNAKERVAGSIVLASNGEKIASLNTYDLQGNLLEVQTKGLDGRVEKNKTTYTYTNKIATCSKTFNYNGNIPVEYYEYKLYDDKNDYLGAEAVEAKVGSYTTGTRKMAYYYDDLGRLVYSDKSWVEGYVKYDYDIHGWLTNITTNCFNEQLYYADGFGKPCYNGNISSLTWNNNNTDVNQGYKFDYDESNRLTSSVYGEYDLDKEKDAKSEYAYYDKNGNIIELYRLDRTNSNPAKSINLIETHHDGNQLSSIRVLTGDDNSYNNQKPWCTVKYNTSGSLVRDDSRGITNIIYDNRNNPRRIQFEDGNVTVYVYSAEGQKLRTIHYTAVPNIKVEPGHIHILSDDEILYKDSTDYMFGGSLILKNGKLDKYLFNGGYCQHTEDGKAKYYYFNQDHLGNNRGVVDEDGKVVQTNNYYPFGTPFYDEENTGFQPFKYNGKELDMMHGLNTYDYGARQYYSLLPTWDRIDPLCEKYYSISPYAYCANNPVNSIDPDGNSTWVINTGNGKYEVIGGNLDDNDRNVYVYSRDKDGKYTVRGQSIGQTTSMTSFYDSDKKKWAEHSIINMNDVSGKQFLNKIVSSEVTLVDYMSNARTGKPYDFKVTNGTDNIIQNINIYRGMTIGKAANGLSLISSARDIGNIAAGIVAAKNGISWSAARSAFDAYQSKCSGHIVREGISTRKAEYYGWSMMHRYSNTHSEIKNIWISIVNFLNNFF